MKRTTCRISGDSLVELFSLGDLYVSDFLPYDAKPRSQKVPLDLCLSPKSGLVQLAHTASFDDMYKHYWYRSGTNESMVEELKQIAESTSRLMRLKTGDVFVDIACNDGTLLSFVEPGVIRIGFDPAENTYKEASQKNFDLFINEYFTARAYRKTTHRSKKKKKKNTKKKHILLI